jgi:3-oxoacyl-[acyl-carrier-protein] synthase II
MRRAIAEAGVTADDIDFVNAHGTGTKANDTAETAVMNEVFGQKRVPISSMKSMFGHCMGAASAIEAAACIFTIESGIYPPTIHFETPDPECDVALVANAAQRGAHRIVVNNSLAFGGYNAVTLFAQPGVLMPPSDRPRAFFAATKEHAS